MFVSLPVGSTICPSYRRKYFSLTVAFHRPLLCKQFPTINNGTNKLLMAINIARSNFQF